MRFIVSSFVLRTLIHLDLNSVQGDKYESIFIFLHAGFQLDQNHLLKMFSFSIVCLSFLIKNQQYIDGCVYFWVFESIPLVHISVFVPISCSFHHCCFVVQPELRDGDSHSSSFIF